MCKSTKVFKAFVIAGKKRSTGSLLLQKDIRIQNPANSNFFPIRLPIFPIFLISPLILICPITIGTIGQSELSELLENQKKNGIIAESEKLKILSELELLESA